MPSSRPYPGWGASFTSTLQASPATIGKVGEGDGELDAVLELVELEENDADGDNPMDMVEEGECVPLALVEAVIEGVMLPVGEGEPVPLPVGETVLEDVARAVPSGDAVPVLLAVIDGVMDAVRVVVAVIVAVIVAVMLAVTEALAAAGGGVDV